MKANNYFKVAIHVISNKFKYEIFPFDDADLKDIEIAWYKAEQYRKLHHADSSRVTMWRTPQVMGAWSTVKLVGEVSNPRIERYLNQV
jgi:hypothetical protein